MTHKLTRATWWVRSHRRQLGLWWERFVLKEIEVGSAIVVLLCDTLGQFKESYHTLAVVHQFAAAGCITILVVHLGRRFHEYKKGNPKCPPSPHWLSHCWQRLCSWLFSPAQTSHNPPDVDSRLI
jgi:hypothetical protein